jgi:hypothetical protein
MATLKYTEFLFLAERGEKKIGIDYMHLLKELINEDKINYGHTINDFWLLPDELKDFNYD